MAPAPIGSVVIDDAHAALSIIRDSLSIRLPSNHKAFDELLKLFQEDIKLQSPNALLDVEEQSFSALARVPFWAWRSKTEKVRKILHTHRESAELKYSWPAVRDVLHLCRAVFSGSELAITPLCTPVGQITHFRDALHRIYLTATLADDSVLVTEFGADPSSVDRPITPITAGDIGERMILAPMELNPAIRVEAVRVAMATLAKRYNVVVIVPSTRIASEWRTYTDNIVYADDVGSMVTQLRNGHVGLVVLVNKYDGIDLPGDACRVLVLDGLPEAFSAEERVESQLINRSSGIDARQVQRIEQGMGRGVRSNEDHCVVFLLGPRLTQLVADPRSFATFGPATQAQLTLSRTMASELEDAPLSAIIAVAQQALTRDPGWVRLAKRTLAAIPPPAGYVNPAAISRRSAFDRAAAGDLVGAADHISSAVAASTDDRERGWLLEQQATYVDQLNPEQAQKIVASARAKNSSVLRPLSGVSYRKLSASKGQATMATDFLTATYEDALALRIGVESLLEGLAFDPDATDRFEQSFSLLGRILGFASERPEHELGEGPDILWALGGLKYWVVEAKTGVTTTFISKHDANQLNGSMLWFHKNYDSTVDARPVMVHPSTHLGKGATATPGLTVITEQTLSQLRDAVRNFVTALSVQRWDSPDVVDQLLIGHHLRSGNLSRYLRIVKESTRLP
jgi:hypothetical protein